MPMLQSSRFQPIFEQLAELEIKKCAHFEADCLEYLSTICSQLERFSLTSSGTSFRAPGNTTMNSLLTLVRANSALISFRIELPTTALTHTLLSLLADTCRNLQEVVLTSDGQFPLKQTTALIDACKDIHTLEFRPRALIGVAVSFIRYRKFSRKNSNRVVTYHKHFESIGYSDEGLAEFFQTIPDFHYVDIKFNAFLSDAVLSNLANKSPNLTSLYIEHTAGVLTPVGVASIFRQCRQLSTLELRGVDHFTLGELVALFSIPKNLQRVALFHATMGTLLSDVILGVCPSIRRYSQGV